MSSWRNQSKIAIDKAIKECKDENYRKVIDLAYPFGERKMYPYKAWLIERKIAFKKLGIIKKESVFEKNSDLGLFNE